MHAGPKYFLMLTASGTHGLPFLPPELRKLLWSHCVEHDWMVCRHCGQIVMRLLLSQGLKIDVCTAACTRIAAEDELGPKHGSEHSST